jgi:hypothetical protein
MPSEIEVIRAVMKTSTPEAMDRLRRMATEGKIKSYGEGDKDEPMTVIATGNHCGIVGCLQARCECGEPVWLSPSTQEMLKGRGHVPTRIICTACFILELERQREKPNA